MKSKKIIIITHTLMMNILKLKIGKKLDIAIQMKAVSMFALNFLSLKN